MTVPLYNPRSIVRGKHGREVKHGYIRLAVVIDGVLWIWQHVIGGEVCSLPGVVQQSILVDVLFGEQLDSVIVVLKNELTWKSVKSAKE